MRRGCLTMARYLDTKKSIINNFNAFLVKNGMDLDVITKRKIIRHIRNEFQRGYDKGYNAKKKVF